MSVSTSMRLLGIVLLTAVVFSTLWWVSRPLANGGLLLLLGAVASAATAYALAGPLTKYPVLVGFSTAILFVVLAYGLIFYTIWRAPPGAFS